MEDQSTATTKPQDLDKMSYVELREVAKNMGIDFAGMTFAQLKMAVGAAPEGAVVVDLSEGLTQQAIQERREKGFRIPKKMIYPKEIEDAVWRIKERNPDAFDNVNFTDKNAAMQHVFSKRTKCVCGETVVMERRYIDRKDKSEVERVDPNPIYKKQCKCGRWYIYHPKEDYEILASDVK